ncbi:LysR family transcriptional regulator [Aeromicrobium endophyticum]|uniref:LysR family transcriptional regulator n=2 Tax=Aeromicrobium endophyticum TaxID=2292704 RepID=A0A371NYZ0_9ACTN|nr:LysR family transcriptional regulator [Aeromicrobium endophyticum]
MIDPRRLRVLLAVALHGSVTAAAAALHMSPSAVSQQVAALEREVGHDMFERYGRRLRLTATGEIMVRHARRLSALLEEAEADLAAAAHGQVGEVSVAAFTSAITEVVAPAVASLRETSPRVRVLVKDAEGPAGRHLLATGEVDIAIGVAHQEDMSGAAAGQHRAFLYTEPFDALVPRRHPLASALAIDVAQLAGDPWIMPWPGNPLRDLIGLACEEAGFRPDVVSVSNDFRAICALVSSGAGVALAPRSALRGIHMHGMKVLPLDTRPPTRRVFVSVRAGADQHPLINQVLVALRQHAAVLDWERTG